MELFTYLESYPLMYAHTLSWHNIEILLLSFPFRIFNIDINEAPVHTSAVV